MLERMPLARFIPIWCLTALLLILLAVLIVFVVSLRTFAGWPRGYVLFQQLTAIS